MALRYKISLLATITVLVVLIPLSVIHIRALAQAEEKEIQGRLQATGRLMATELFTSELGAESKARQYMFLREAQKIDTDILFIAVYQGKIDIAVLNRAGLPSSIKGSDSEIIEQFVEQGSNSSVHYVSIDLPENRKLLMGYSIATIEQGRRRRQLSAIGWALGLTILAVAGSMFFAQRLTRPIHKLLASMSSVAQGDLDVRLEHQSRDEIGRLAQGFNQMVADLQENVLERQRMQHELELAHDMQMSLMPKAAPQLEGVEIAGRCVPAQTVGGDFYDYVTLAGDTPAIVVADVSGKGMKAAMHAVLSYGALHAETKFGISPCQMLGVLNHDLYDRFQDRTNCAMCLAILDVQEGVLQYANAGLPYPIVKRSEKIFELESNGMPLGAFRRAEYEDVALELQSGDVLVFFSDGVTESRSQDNSEQLYMETERLFSVIDGFKADMKAPAMIDAIFADIGDFSGDTDQSDDITIVVVKIQ